MTLQQTQGQLAAYDGTRLHWQSWRPEEVIGFVLLVHGVAEHCDRYRPTAEFLAEQGFAVYGFDLRGHGRSEGDRAFVKTFQDYLQDLDGMVQWVQEQTSGHPLFLLGHSMGGAIATRYVQVYPHRQAELSGLALSAPALVINDDVPKPLLMLSAVLSRLFPKLPTVALEDAAISRDPAVVEAYRADPLVYHGKWLARTGAELVKAIEAVQADMAAIHSPLLLMHGTADSLVPAQASQMLYGGVRSADKTLKLYEGLYHELCQEPERSQVWADLNQWLQAHLD